MRRVPSPASADLTKFLRADKTWAVPAGGFLPVIPVNVTQSQTIPTGCAALMVDGTTFDSGVAIVFQGTAIAIFIKQLQLS